MRRPPTLCRPRALALILSLLCGLAAPAALAQAAAPHRCEGFIIGSGRDHPLACRYFAADGRELASREVVDMLRQAPFVLLGEVHDNPDHHRLRAELIGRLHPPPTASTQAAEGSTSPPALVFEHIRANQTGAVEAYARAVANDMQEPQRVAALAAIESGLEWDKSGWPAFRLFQPLFAAAISGRHPISAGDPPRAAVRRVAREGAGALAATELARLQLDAPMPPPLTDALLAELEASHCGLMPRTAFGTMVLAQHYRDAHQAAALIAAAERSGRAILLAGNGHVRNDRAVPYFLRRMAPARPFISVHLLEIVDGSEDPAAYLPRDPDGKPAADIIGLTPRVERPDPCAGMRRHFARPPQ